jgi:hypothetical protein
MTSLCISPEARSAAPRCFPAYQIAVGPDLFGAWLVEMSYGRIGTTGHAKVRSFATTEEALAQVDACLRKRATATPDRRAIPGAGGDNRSTMRLQTRRLTITSR